MIYVFDSRHSHTQEEEIDTMHPAMDDKGGWESRNNTLLDAVLREGSFIGGWHVSRWGT